MARRFCLVWLSSTLVLVLAVGGFDAVIDPYLVIGAPRIAGLNAAKPATETHTELAKDYLLARARPAGVMIGDSKVDIGLDPDSPAWPDDARPAFNDGVPGIGTLGMLDHLRQAIAAAPIRRALVMIELQDLMSPLPPAADTVSAPGLWQRVHDVLLSTLSLDALRASIATVLAQGRRDGVDLSPQGATSEGGFRAVVAADGEHILFLQKDRDLAARFERLAAALRVHPHADPGRLGPVAEMIALCRPRGIALDLVIAPFHADFLELIAGSGLWQHYEQAKLDLTRLVSSSGGGSTRLWDFGGYDAYTSEPVPAAADRHGQTRWFWEPSHFKKVLGEKLLATIYRGAPGFGVQLTPDTVEAHLRADAITKAAYEGGDHGAHERLAASVSALGE